MSTEDSRWLLTDEERRAKGMGPWTKIDDPAHFLLTSGPTSSTTVHDDACYICLDPEFAAMGMPLCRECTNCKASGRGLGHVPADDEECTVCGFNEREAYELEQARAELWLSMPCHEDPPAWRSIVIEEYAMVGGVTTFLGSGAPLGDFPFKLTRWAKTRVRYSWQAIGGHVVAAGDVTF